MAENTKGKVLDWDDEIENDGQEYILLPEGDYNFRVTGFKRGTFKGGAKIPQCKQAELTLEVVAEDGTAICYENLILYSSMEWKLAAFFRSIGQKKHGEKVKMDWSKVNGAEGRAHFKPRSYEKDGETKQVNAVDKYIDYDPNFFSAVASVETVEADDDKLPF